MEVDENETTHEFTMQGFSGPLSGCHIYRGFARVIRDWKSRKHEEKQ
jgi:hypothetical protein